MADRVDRLRTTAIHEAGHIVVGASCGLPVGSIRMSLGGLYAEAECDDWKAPPIPRAAKCYAGPRAEIRCSGTLLRTHAREDYRAIGSRLRAAPTDHREYRRLWRQAREAADAALDQHWAAVEALADALLQHESELDPGYYRLMPHEVQQILRDHGIDTRTQFQTMDQPIAGNESGVNRMQAKEPRALVQRAPATDP